jgi:hypothetical protein
MPGTEYKAKRVPTFLSAASVSVRPDWAKFRRLGTFIRHLGAIFGNKKIAQSHLQKPSKKGYFLPFK